MRKLALSYFDLTVAQIGVALNVIIGKYLLGIIPIFCYLGFRFLLTTVFLWGILRWSGVQAVLPEHPEGKMTKRDRLLLIGQGLTAGFLFNILMMMGLMYTTATSAGIVSSSFPAVLALISLWLLGERISRQKWVGILLAVLGILILSLGSNSHGLVPDGEAGLTSSTLTGSILGDFLVFLSMIPEALYSILAKFLNHRIHSLYTAYAANLSACLMMLPLAIYSSWGHDWESFTWFHAEIIVVGAILSALFYALWSRALCTVPASTAALFGGVLPVTTALAAIFILKESFTFFVAIGMVLVLLSLYIGTRPAHLS